MAQAESLVIIVFTLAVLPIAIGALTCYLKVNIVLSALRASFSAQNFPGQMFVLSVSILVTLIVMNPILMEIQDNFIKNPIHEITFNKLKKSIDNFDPLRGFLYRNSDPDNLKFFSEKLKAESDSWNVVIPSFIITELKEAFEIAVLIYLPFLAIDIIVSSILVSSGMFMLSPNTVALPIKIGVLIVAEPWLKIFDAFLLSYR